MFVIFVFVDPTAVLLLGFEPIAKSDAATFAVLFIMGTAQWYIIALMLHWIARRIFRLKHKTGDTDGSDVV